MEDRVTGRHFLVDCGADISVFPVSTSDRSYSRSTTPLTAANGSKISCWGKRTVSLRLGRGAGRAFKQDFYLAEVTEPILGADFFIANNLAIDMAGGCLVDLHDFSAIKTIPCTRKSTVSGLHVSRINAFDKIVDEYPELLVPRFQSTDTNKHGVEHFIETEGPPVHAKARRLSDDKMSAARAQFADLEKQGVIRRSNSPWSSPLHLTKKADGTWRPCGDYRRLNDATVDDRYPLPHLHDFNARLQGCTIFSKIDLVRGYNQVPMREGHIPKTAIITPFGLFEFVRMPFGLKNAAQTFQRMMDGILGDIPYAFVYLDDVLIASVSPELHEVHLRSVLRLLAENGLVINRAKCVFGVPELEYLGHRVSHQGILPLESRVEAVRSYPVPDCKRSLQRFLGFINFYRRFVPHIAHMLHPLNEATRGKGQKIEWTEACASAFVAVKSALADATLLNHPNPSLPTSVTVDASQVAVGGELAQQHADGSWRPVAYFSRKLSDCETRYSAYDRELLAMYLSIKNFRPYVEGKPFTLYTDQKPLTTALATSSDDRSPRQANHLSYISQFTSDIRHVDGKCNFVADALTRAPIDTIASVQQFTIDSISLGVDYCKMAREQQLDDQIKKQRTCITGLSLVDVPIANDLLLLCDNSTGVLRPVVPGNMQREVFNVVHNLRHPSIRATRQILTAKFVWHGVGKQVSWWAKTCSCQTSKVQSHVRAPINSYNTPARRFDHINVDLVGPLPVSQGYSHLLTIVDRFTRWPEAIPISDTTTTAVARALLYNWVSRFGVPLEISSDRGSQFVSELWSAMASMLGTHVSRTTSYHPQANGLVERFHRTMKQSLRARLTDCNWVDQLPWVLLGIRTMPKEDIGASSAELVYGAPLTVPGDFAPMLPNQLSPSVAEHLRTMRGYVEQLVPVPMSRHGDKQIALPSALRTAQFVFVRVDGHKTPLAKPYTGPYQVLQRDDKHFLLQIGTRQDRVSVDRLKPAHIDSVEPLPVAIPPRRGRPPTLPRGAAKPAVRVPPGDLHQGPPPDRMMSQVPAPAAPLRSGRIPRPVVRFQS